MRKGRTSGKGRNRKKKIRRFKENDPYNNNNTDRKRPKGGRPRRAFVYLLRSGYFDRVKLLRGGVSPGVGYQTAVVPPRHGPFDRRREGNNGTRSLSLHVVRVLPRYTLARAGTYPGI